MVRNKKASDDRGMPPEAKYTVFELSRKARSTQQWLILTDSYPGTAGVFYRNSTPCCNGIRFTGIETR